MIARFTTNVWPHQHAVSRWGRRLALVCALNVLPAHAAILEGEAVYRKRTMPPPDAVLVVVLQDTALRLSPRDPARFHLPDNLIWAQFSAKAYDDAIDTARQSLREANFAGTRPCLVLCLVGAGNLARAASELLELKRLESQIWWPLGWEVGGSLGTPRCVSARPISCTRPTPKRASDGASARTAPCRAGSESPKAE